MTDPSDSVPVDLKLVPKVMVWLPPLLLKINFISAPSGVEEALKVMLTVGDTSKYLAVVGSTVCVATLGLKPKFVGY